MPCSGYSSLNNKRITSFYPTTHSYMVISDRKSSLEAREVAVVHRDYIVEPSQGQTDTEQQFSGRVQQQSRIGYLVAQKHMPRFLELRICAQRSSTIRACLNVSRVTIQHSAAWESTRPTEVKLLHGGVMQGPTLPIHESRDTDPIVRVFSTAKSLLQCRSSILYLSQTCILPR